jgi:hypothetical protein
MKLENEKYDDYLPLATVKVLQSPFYVISAYGDKFFGREFITGFSRVMSDMGFDHEMRIDFSLQDS